MTGPAFADRLERHGFDFFAGVPCSLIEDLIAALERHPRLPYVAAVREDIAVGVAGGAWFGGRRPAVLMQNSGLGTSGNALASFSLLYGLPALLLVTWRGRDGNDAPEHLLTGAITPPTLDLLGIPHRTLTSESVDADLDWAVREMDARMQPVGLLVSSEGTSTAPSETSPRFGAPAKLALEPRPGEYAAADVRGRISRRAAIAAAVKELGDALLISCNGYPSRETFAVADRPANFYMIGSMGLAAATGLGLASARPNRRVVVFDGDGNLMMGLGVLANVATLAPRNFVHVVFDNEAYGSTGDQRSVSAGVRLDRLAAAAGYRTVSAVDDADGVAGAVRRMLAGDGPHFLLVKVTREGADVPRISHTPAAIRDRFRAAVLAS